MKTDDGLRGIFREHLPTAREWSTPVHFVTVESGATSRGIPDSAFCLAGVEGWIEMKRAYGRRVKFKPGQVAWHSLHWRAGGRSFIAVRRRHKGGPRLGRPVDELWLYAGRDAMSLMMHGLIAESPVPTDVGGVEPIGIWSGGPARWDWDAIASLLRCERPRVGDARPPAFAG